MANLILDDISWDENKPKLMYVSFIINGKVLKWYPKWAELYDLLHRAYLTESGQNKGKMSYYFQLMCAEILLNEIQVQTPNFNHKTNILISELFYQLRNDAIQLNNK